MATRIRVTRHQGGHRVHLAGGLLRPQLVRDRPDQVRIGLVATTALLLGGDEVDLEVQVGPGASLGLFDVAGTVAYHGRGRPAARHTTVLLAEGARLRYEGAPFVVVEGADVERSLELDLHPAASVWLRETVVLGRSGEVGGRLRNRTTLTLDGCPALLEDQVLDPSGIRRSPGMLGSHRVIDTVLEVGTEETGTPPSAAIQFGLVGGVGSITRYLGTDAAASPLQPV